MFDDSNDLILELVTKWRKTWTVLMNAIKKFWTAISNALFGLCPIILRVEVIYVTFELRRKVAVLLTV